MASVTQSGTASSAGRLTLTAGQLPSRIEHELHRLAGRVRLLSFLSGFAAALIATTVVASLLLAVDYWFDLSSFSRWIGLIVLIFIGTGLVGWGLRRSLAPVPLSDLAAAVEEKHPEFGERLLSLVEFSDPEVDEQDKGSAMMRRLLEKETLELVSPTDFAAVIDHSRTRVRAIAALVAIMVLLTPYLFAAGNVRLLWARLLTPWNNYERPSNLFFEVPHGDRVVPRDEDAKIIAIAGWHNQQREPIQEVRLTWTFDGATPEARRMAWDEAASAYSTTLPTVQRGFRYSISSGRSRTREFQIRVEDRPAISSLQIEVQPPSYTGLPVEQLTAATAEIHAFEQSLITLQVGLNKPVSHLDLVWIELESATQDAAAQAAGIEDDSPEALYLKSAEEKLVIPDHLQGKFPGWIIRAIEPMALATDRKTANHSFRASRPGRFILHAVDEFGLDNPKEPIRTIDLTSDQPPTVEFADSNEQGTARPDEIIEVPIYATDDVGIAALDLQVKTFPEGKLLKTISLESEKLGTQEIGKAFPVNLAEFGLQPNDMISVRSRAADERQTPGPNETWTSERLIRIQQDSLPYGFEEIAKEREAWKNELEQLRNEVITNRSEIQDIQKSLDKSIAENKPFDQDAQATQYADAQQEIADKGEKLAATLSKHPLFEKLAPGVEASVREDILPAAEKTRGIPTTPDPTTKAEALKQVVTELNEADARLRGLLLRYEQQAMLERDLFELQRLANRTEQLAEDTAKYEESRDAAEIPEAERNPDTPQPPSAEEQNQQRDMLLARHQGLSQDLNQLIFKRPELVSAAQEALIGRLQKLLDQAGELADREEQLSAALTQEAEAMGSSQNPDTIAKVDDGTPAPASETTPVPPSVETPPASATPADNPGKAVIKDSVARAIDEQQRIALAARELALNSEAQTGKESAATLTARKFAEQAETALRELTSGNSNKSAESAKVAGQSGDQATELYRKLPKSLGGPNEDMAASSARLAERQSALSTQLSEISKSPAGRREIQQQAQQQLQNQTQRLTDELGQVAESFGMQPLQQDNKAQEAQASGNSAQRAQEAMLATNQNLRENKLKEAAQQASDAANALRQAGNLPTVSKGQDQPPSPADAAQPPNPADSAKPQADKPSEGKSGEGQPDSPPPPSPDGNSSVPPEGALNVAQAAQQLNKIGKQLSKDAHGTAGQKPGEGQQQGDPQQTDGDPTAKGDRQPNPNGDQPKSSQAGENTDGQSKTAMKETQDKAGSGQQGKNPGEQSASNGLKQTAANMRKAMSQFGLPNGDPGKPSSGGKSESDGDSQATNQSDFGNQDEAKIVELENHLRGLSTRNWGELPGSLKTEILQSSRKRPDGDYTQLIRRYFDEISRTQLPDPPKPQTAPPAAAGSTP